MAFPDLPCPALADQGELFGIKNLLTFERADDKALRKSGTHQIIKGGRSGFEGDKDGDDHEGEQVAPQARTHAAPSPHVPLLTSVARARLSVLDRAGGRPQGGGGGRGE